MSKVKKKTSFKALYYNRALRLSVLTGLSSASAYLLATFIPLADPFIAAITGLVAISSTFHNSLKSAFAEMIGVLVGSVVGLFFINWLGFNIFTLGMLITLAYILSWGLRLGYTAAVPIGVTMILVCGPLLDNVVGLEGRMLGVLVGAACALIASYFVLPGKPHERALNEMRTESAKAAELLQKVAVRLAEGSITASEASQWLNQSQRLTERSKEFLDDAKDAVRGAKWSPMLSRKETNQYYKQVKSLNNIIVSVNNICADLENYIIKNGDISEGLIIKLSELLKTTAEHISSEVETVSTKTGKLTLTSKLQTKKRETIETVKSMDETQAIMLGGSIVRDATIIRESLK